MDNRNNIHLRAIVFSNLNNALENGFDMLPYTAFDHAIELAAYAADCEDYTPFELEPHCEAWLRSKMID